MVNAITVFPKSGGDKWFDQDVNKAGYKIFNSFEQTTQTAYSGASSSIAYATARDYHIIQNLGSETVYINFDAAATGSSYEIPAFDERTFETNGSVIHMITYSGAGIGFGGSAVVRIWGMV